MDFDGRVALITGGAHGIGLATARLLAAHGARVAVAALHAEACNEAVAGIRRDGGEAISVPTDLMDLRQIDRMVEACLATYGRIDILHNNAYWSVDRDAVAAEEVEWDHTLGVCLKAVWYACKLVLPGMCAAGSGVIVNTSSVEGLVAVPDHCPYATAKAALNHLTRQMAVDFGPKGIRVNAVVPGAVDTRDWDALGPNARTAWAETTPLRRLGTVEDIARVVMFLASPDAAYVTGECLVVDGGWSITARMDPQWMNR